MGERKDTKLEAAADWWQSRLPEGTGAGPHIAGNALISMHEGYLEEHPDKLIPMELRQDRIAKMDPDARRALIDLGLV